MEFVLSEVQKLYKTAGEPSLEELLTAIEAILQHCELVYVVIDAMDESSPRSNLLKIIRDLATDVRFSKIQILATSRDYIDIERTIENISTPITKSNPLVEEDIRILVKSHLSSNERFKRWPRDLLGEVEETVTTGAKGMFRWAVCQLDILQRMKCERNIVKNALATLPKTLDETYERIFLCIPEEEWSFVHRALQWVHYHNELYGGEGISCSILLKAIQNTVDASSEGSQDLFYNIDRLRELCGCLISVITEDKNQQQGASPVERVSFAHYTVLEYLDSTRVSKGPVAYFAICTKGVRQQFTEIAFLKAQKIVDTDCMLEGYSPTSDEVYDKLCRDFTFYCVCSAIFSLTLWQEDICQLDKLFDAVKEFLDPSKPFFESISITATLIDNNTEIFRDANISTQFLSTGIEWRTNPVMTDAAVLLYLLLSSEYSTPVLARRFLEEKDDRGFLSRRLDFIMEVLLVKSDGNMDDYIFSGSIIEIMAQLAFENSYNFELLFDYGLGFFDPSNILLSYTGSRGEDTVLLLRLLQAGADPNVKGYRVTPLQIATGNWDYKGVEILVQAGADLNFTGDVDGVEWEAGTSLSRFKFLHGSIPLYICRNFDSNFQFGRQDDRASNFKGIESLLLKNGAVEIKG